MTYTCATLEVPKYIHDFFEKRLRAAGYDHAISDEGIDMTHIMLTASKEDTEWATAQALADTLNVDEVLAGFADDPTGDNGTIVVREVLRSVSQS